MEHKKIIKCDCCICKAKRGEYKGKNNPFYGKKHSEIVLKKMRQPRSKEACQRMRMNKYKPDMSGKNNPMFGKHHSKKTIEKMRNIKIDKIPSDKTRIKMSKAQKGKHDGKKNAMFGKHHTNESNDKRRKTRGETARRLGYYHSEQTIKKILKSVQAKPNKFETRALVYLNLIYNNKFKYTGDGSFIVNHRSADAYSKELNTVVLFNGIYWHLLRLGYENSEESKKIIETKESIPFVSAGYKVIFIWEDELNELIRKYGG